MPLEYRIPQDSAIKQIGSRHDILRRAQWQCTGHEHWSTAGAGGSRTTTQCPNEAIRSISLCKDQETTRRHPSTATICGKGRGGALLDPTGRIPAFRTGPTLVVDIKKGMSFPDKSCERLHGWFTARSSPTLHPKQLHAGRMLLPWLSRHGAQEAQRLAKTFHLRLRWS